SPVVPQVTAQSEGSAEANDTQRDLFFAPSSPPGRWAGLYQRPGVLPRSASLTHTRITSGAALNAHSSAARSSLGAPRRPRRDGAGSLLPSECEPKDGQPRSSIAPW